MIAIGAPLPPVLDTLCALIDQESGLISSVYVLDRDRNHLMFAAGPHVPPPFAAATRSFAATPTSSSCGAPPVARRAALIPRPAAPPLRRGLREQPRAGDCDRRRVQPALCAVA